MKVFGPSRKGEHIYSANFTVKFPFCKNGEMAPLVLRPTCPLSPLCAPRPDFLPDLSSHTLALISALFNAAPFPLVRISSPYFMSPLSCRPCELFVTSRYPRRNKISPDFQLRIRVQEKIPSPLCDLPIFRVYIRCSIIYTSLCISSPYIFSDRSFVSLHFIPPDNIYRTVRPFIAIPLLSLARWHGEGEKFCLWDTEMLDICQKIA